MTETTTAQSNEQVPANIARVRFDAPRAAEVDKNGREIKPASKRTHPVEMDGMSFDLDRPTSFADLVSEKFYPSEQLAVDAAWAFLLNKKLGSVKRSANAVAEPDRARVLTQETVQGWFDSVTGAPARRGRAPGSGKNAEVKAKADQMDQIRANAQAKMRELSPATLRQLASIGLYSTEEVEAHLASRK